MNDMSAQVVMCEHLSHCTSLQLDEKGPTLSLWNKLTKCPLPTLAWHFVLCKYGSMSQSGVRRNCGGRGATVSLSRVYYEQTGLQLLWMELQGNIKCLSMSFVSDLFLSPSLSLTDSTVSEASLPGSALSRGGREEL